MSHVEKVSGGSPAASFTKKDALSMDAKKEILFSDAVSNPTPQTPPSAASRPQSADRAERLKRSTSFGRAKQRLASSLFGSRSTRAAVRTPPRRDSNERIEQEKKAAQRLAEMEEYKREEANAEVRYGMRINPHPAVRLKTPKAKPPETDEERRKRELDDAAATARIPDNLPRYINIVKKVSLFSEMGDEELEMAARAFEVRTFRAGDMIYDEASLGRDAWVLEEGEVLASVLIPGIAGAGWEWKETRPYKAGQVNCFFGERGLRRGEPRNMRMICKTDVKALRITQDAYVECARKREYKENLLRGVQLFEQMTDDQIGKLARVIKREHFKANQTIYTAKSTGHAFYLIETGEASTNPPPPFFTSPRNYNDGEIFGERALTESPCIRDETVTAVGEMTAYYLSREDFEKELCPLVELQLAQLRADPRTLIAQFYQQGDYRGPAGSIRAKQSTIDTMRTTDWFAIYRPCSRDSIAKMLGGVGVGKGLNIKGKSAQKNRLSGFVPFLQIHNNDHKKDVEASPKDARCRIFFKNVMAREEAMGALNKVMREGDGRTGEALEVAVMQIWPVDEPYAPTCFGLDVPEPVVREAYIMRPDLSPIIGWETGRPSVPEFMDMNLHGIREDSYPKVVLYQYDLSDPMNPHGLLIAYAESAPQPRVKPVCSDFDTFTVGSRGMRYDAMPEEQCSLIHWELDQLEAVLQKAPHESTSWTGHWLRVIKEAEEGGMHPNYPSRFGFGEPTSTRLISDVVDATQQCGAVRHGAECFNFWFPQELDRDYLIVWDGYTDSNWTPELSAALPWRQAKENEVRQFLIDRAREGYSFPLNPIWPVRNPGWYDVLQALMYGRETRENLDKWFPPDSGIVAKIETLRKAYPRGFTPASK